MTYTKIITSKMINSDKYTDFMINADKYTSKTSNIV